MRRAPLLLLALAAACGAKEGAAPWNTDPGVAGHTWFPLAGTAHEPTPSGPLNAVSLCRDCHPGASFKAPPDCKTCHFAQSPAPNDMGPHTGNTAYAAALATGRTDYCLTCHPQGMAYSAVNHTKFPIGLGSKHNRACSLCHTSTVGRDTAIADGTLNCVTCHRNQLPPPNDTLFPPPSIDARHALVLDYVAASVTPRDCMRCHDPTAMAPSAGAGNLVLHVSAHGSRGGPPGFGSAGPWDGRHGNAGAAVRCWSCHGSVPALFPNAVGPSGTAGPWAQDWSVGPPANACTYPKPAGSSQVSCCTDCHGVKN